MYSLQYFVWNRIQYYAVLVFVLKLGKLFQRALSTPPDLVNEADVPKHSHTSPMFEILPNDLYRPNSYFLLWRSGWFYIWFPGGLFSKYLEGPDCLSHIAALLSLNNVNTPSGHSNIHTGSDPETR